MSVGQRVMAVRVWLGMIQDDFVKPLPIEQGTLSHIENDTPGQPVSPKTMDAMIAAYGVNPDYIYNGKGDMFTKDVKGPAANYGKVAKKVSSGKLERLIKHNEILIKEKERLEVEVPRGQLERLITENKRLIKVNGKLTREKEKLIKEKEWFRKQIDTKDAQIETMNALTKKLLEGPDRLRVDKEKGVPWPAREL